VGSDLARSFHEIPISDRGAAGFVAIALSGWRRGADGGLPCSNDGFSFGSGGFGFRCRSSFPAAAKAVNSGVDASSLVVTGKTVVKVNDAELTDRDLLREMFALFPYAKLHGGFPKKEEAEIRQGAMQMIIFEELVYQEAVRRKMTIAPARMTREEHNFKGQFPSQEEFNST
jgi:hypothetical protein